MSSIPERWGWNSSDIRRIWTVDKYGEKVAEMFLKSAYEFAAFSSPSLHCQANGQIARFAFNNEPPEEPHVSSVQFRTTFRWFEREKGACVHAICRRRFVVEALWFLKGL